MRKRQLRPGAQSIFEITLRGHDDCPPLVATAETAGQAKYRAFMGLDEIYDSFGDFLSSIESVRRIGSVMPDLAQKQFVETCARRGIPFAKIGMAVKVGKRKGTIIGVNSSANLDVAFANGQTGNCHPTWNITYYNNEGNIICSFAEEAAG